MGKVRFALAGEVMIRENWVINVVLRLIEPREWWDLRMFGLGSHKITLTSISSFPFLLLR